MRVLVTGGGGFIGHHLVRRLLADGHDVQVLDNFSTGLRERLLGLDARIIEGDLRSYERVHTAVRGVEAVFHLGALPSVQRSIQDPLATHAVNVDGTLNVLLASRDEGVRRVAFASSSSVYGANPALPKSEADIPLPMSPYAVSKLAAERYCAAFHEVYGLETVALRLFNVFGPGQSPLSEYAAVVPCFVASMLAGNAPTVYGDGGQTRDFTFVEDVVDAFVRAATVEGVGGSTFNIAGGHQLSILDLAATIANVIGWEGEPRFEPGRDGEVRFSEGNADAARERLGWQPATPARVGLERCVAAAELSAAP